MRLRISLCLVSALLCPLLLSSSAQGDYEPLASGSTRLALDKRFVSFLREAGVTLTASSGASKRGSAIRLPVNGGQLDPLDGRGEVAHRGSIVFESGRRKVPWKRLVVRKKPTPLIAKVGGSQLKVASSRDVSSRRDGFGTKLAARALRLTAKVATRLNKKLRPEARFEAGQLVGALVSEPEPKLIEVLPSGKASLGLAPAFLAKLDSRFVSVNPIAPAERQGPTLTFPLAIAGTISPSGGEGTVRTAGAVELLQQGAGQIFWQELWVDLGVDVATAEVDLQPAPAFPGKLGRVGVFGAGGGSVSADRTQRTVSVSNLLVTLQADTARAMNQAFAGGAEVFAAGEAVGSLSFTAQGQ